MRTRPVEAACLRAARSGSVSIGLPFGARRARCAVAGSDETPGCTVSALRLSADSDLPSSRGPSHEPSPCPSSLASGGSAASSPTPTSSGSAFAASSAAGLRRQPRLGLRLRVRHLRQWPEPEVPHRDRRIHPRGTRDRCRRQHPLRSRDRGADPPRSANVAHRASCARTTARSSSARRSSSGSSSPASRPH